MKRIYALCRPCAEQMRRTGRRVAILPRGMDQKITCTRCARRRYGGACQVKTNLFRAVLNRVGGGPP